MHFIVIISKAVGTNKKIWSWGLFGGKSYGFRRSTTFYIFWYSLQTSSDFFSISNQEFNVILLKNITFNF